MLKELIKDKLSDVLAIAEIMDILNKSGEDIPKNVFSFLTESLLKALKETGFIAPQYDNLSDDGWIRKRDDETSIGEEEKK